MSHLGHSSHSLWALYFLYTHLHSNSESHTSAAGFSTSFSSIKTNPSLLPEAPGNHHSHSITGIIANSKDRTNMFILCRLYFHLQVGLISFVAVYDDEQKFHDSDSRRIAVRHPDESTLYSHASSHYQRLDSAAARCQRKVDSPVGQDHPLAPQTAALKQSDGRQRELLEKAG